MKVVRSVTPGTMAADLVDEPLVAGARAGPAHPRSTASEACCSGKSTYLQTLSHSAIAVSVSVVTVVG